MSLSRVWEAVEPYPEVKKGVISEDTFAAELAPVISGKAPKIYLDPKEFFEKTFLTRSLDGLIRSVLGRVSKRGAEPAILRLETVFGGGKTHALLVLYHIFHNPATSRQYIEHILRGLGISSIPKVRMAVLTGKAFDPESGFVHGDITTYTLWGELAYQLGGKELYSKFQGSDEKKIPPGTKRLEELFDVPSIVLIDEISEYLNRSAGIKVGNTTLAEQTISFIHELTEVAASTESSVFVITLPTEADPYRKYTHEVIEAIEDVRKVVGRVATIFTPVGPEEIYDVARIRLFKKMDEEVRDDVVKEFTAFYQALPGQFPSKTVEAGYMEKLRKSYPIHPELIDTLYERVSTIPDFQRTRGVLRLLAYVVFKVYETKPTDAFMIMPSHVDLSYHKILDELTLKIGRSLFQPAIISDIASKKGDAKAQRIDNDLASVGIKNNLATRLASSIFLYSLIGAAREDFGAVQQQLYLSLAYPGFNVRQVPDVLKRLMDELWYLYESAGRYSIRTEPNINKVIEEVKDSIKAEDIKSEIEVSIREKAGTTFFSKDKIFVWPRDQYDIPDSSDPKLIIFDYAAAKARNPQEFMAESLPTHLSKVSDIYNKSGEHYRQYKNTVFFLIADETNIERLFDRGRVKLSVETVRNNKEIAEKLTKDQKESLEQKYGDANFNFEISLLQAYRYVVCPAHRGRLSCFTLSVEERVRGERKLTKFVYDKLKTEGKIVSEKVSEDLIVEKCWVPQDRASVSTQEIYEAFARYTDLPFVESTETVANAIKSGVLNEKFGYASVSVEALQQTLEGPFWFNNVREGLYADYIEISPSTYLIKAELSEKIAEAIQKKRVKKPEVVVTKEAIQATIPLAKGGQVSQQIAVEAKKFLDRGVGQINSMTLQLKGSSESIIATSSLAAMISALTGASIVLKSASFTATGDMVTKMELSVEGLQGAIQALRNIMEAAKENLKTIRGEIVIEVKAGDKPISIKTLDDLSKMVKGYKDIEFSLTWNGAKG